MQIKIGDLIASFSKRQSSRYFFTIVVDGNERHLPEAFACTGWKLGAPGTRMFIGHEQAHRAVATFGGVVSDRGFKCFTG